MPRNPYWTCGKVTKGVKCGYQNPLRAKKCQRCSKPRPAKKRAKHLAALELSYEEYIALQGGEFCGICGFEPKDRRLDRDHDHGTGKPRGLLCPRCNLQLPNRCTIEWLRSAVAYLERASFRYT